jgi:SPP1 family predicted phage head-tail adaptor
MISERGNSNPGRLDRRVVLQYRSVTRDSMGGEVIEWVNAATVWAEKVPVGGNRMYSAEGKSFANTLEYTIRHRSDVETGWRLVHGDDVFEITATDPSEARNDRLTLSLRAINQSIGYAERQTGVDVRLLHDGSQRLLHDDSSVLLHAA